jgi:hypothetical protein
MTEKELLGREVEIRYDLETAGGEMMPAGAKATIIRKFKGIWLEFDNNCPHCKFGCKTRIRHIDPYALRLIPKEKARAA